MQKKCRKICTCQKKAVLLHAFLGFAQNELTNFINQPAWLGSGFSVKTTETRHNKQKEDSILRRKNATSLD